MFNFLMNVLKLTAQIFIHFGKWSRDIAPNEIWTFPLIAILANLTCLPVGSLSSQSMVQMLVYIYLDFKVKLESVLDDFKIPSTALGQR